MTEQNDQDYKTLIMVIDDNPEFLSGITLTLEMEGFEVWTATEGQQALNELRAAFQKQNQEASERDRLPDLILADIMMPVMDGYDLYEEMRANPYTNHIPFIFLTAKSSDIDVRRGKELGADDYFSKMAPPEDLLASIRGKLKRVKQRRSLFTQLSGDSDGLMSGASTVAIIVIGALLIAAFILGVLFATGVLG